MDPSWEAIYCVPLKSKVLMAGGGMRRGWKNLVFAAGGTYKSGQCFLHGIVHRLHAGAMGGQGSSSSQGREGQKLVPWPVSPIKFR